MGLLLDQEFDLLDWEEPCPFRFTRHALGVLWDMLRSMPHEVHAGAGSAEEGDDRRQNRGPDHRSEAGHRPLSG